VDAGPGGLVPPQPRGWAHLVSVRAGVAELRCRRVRTFVTPNVAIWIPSGLPYALDLQTSCRLRILYADEAIYAVRPFGPLQMTPLMRELVERAVTSGFLDARLACDRHLLAVIRDELARLCDANVASVIVLPRDAALLAIAERLGAHPDDTLRIAELAASVDMSLRTFERRFASETGLAPREWIRRARLSSAMLSLASGASVTEAGLACGYASLSAFISAFRAVHGVTPGTFAAAALGATLAR
jgi:AraC-like DNA-binding protein